MKTIYKYTAPDRGAKVRLVERQTFVPPATDGMPGTFETSFTVILDVKDGVAMFDNFSDIEFAAGTFATLCDRFGGVTAASQVVLS